MEKRTGLGGVVFTLRNQREKTGSKRAIENV
jgi:hypothetical protein